jgi:hypothetical protein
MSCEQQKTPKTRMTLILNILNIFRGLGLQTLVVFLGHVLPFRIGPCF